MSATPRHSAGVLPSTRRRCYARSMRTSPLASALHPLLPTGPTPTLYVGPWKLGRALAERLPLVALDPHLPRARKLGGSALVARTTALPFVSHSFACMLLVGQLRPAPELGRGLLAVAGTLLQQGGLLLLVERLRGLFAPRGMRPDSVSALLLNAGFESIEQRWSVSKTVITSARPGACVEEPPTHH